MIGQGGQGWATTLADLSIILFMITAADLSNAEIAHEAITDAAPATTAAEPVAIYRPGGGAPTLREWLASQPGDPRQRLTIVVHYTDDHPEEALGAAIRLNTEARAAGRQPRMIVEKSAQPTTAIILAYDSDPDSVARELQGQSDTKTWPRTNTENVR